MATCLSTGTAVIAWVAAPASNPDAVRSTVATVARPDIGGTTTDMIAVVSDSLFMQIWIGADDKLPRRMRAVFKGDPLLLRPYLAGPAGRARLTTEDHHISRAGSHASADLGGCVFALIIDQYDGERGYVILSE